MPDFERPPYVTDNLYNNLKNDEVCPEPLIKSLVDKLSRCADEAASKATHQEWISNIDKATLPRLKSIEVKECGRLAFWRVFYDYIFQEIEKTHGPGLVSLSDVAETIEQIIGETSNFTPEEADDIFNTYIKDINISGSMVWLFLVDERVDLARDLSTDSCLPWRLGLNRVSKGVKYIGMILRATGINDARLPCNADIEYHYHDLWRAGGETLRLGGTPDTCDPRGCHEIVAPPPAFSTLSVPLRNVTAL